MPPRLRLTLALAFALAACDTREIDSGSEVIVAEGQVLTAQAYADAGAPVPGAVVTVQRSLNGGAFDLLPAQRVTDSDGRYRVEFERVAGTLILSARGDAYLGSALVEEGGLRRERVLAPMTAESYAEATVVRARPGLPVPLVVALTGPEAAEALRRGAIGGGDLAGGLAEAERAETAALQRLADFGDAEREGQQAFRRGAFARFRREAGEATGAAGRAEAEAAFLLRFPFAYPDSAALWVPQALALQAAGAAALRLAPTEGAYEALVPGVVRAVAFATGEAAAHSLRSLGDAATVLRSEAAAGPPGAAARFRAAAVAAVLMEGSLTDAALRRLEPLLVAQAHRLVSDVRAAATGLAVGNAYALFHSGVRAAVLAEAPDAAAAASVLALAYGLGGIWAFQ